MPAPILVTHGASLNFFFSSKGVSFSESNFNLSFSFRLKWEAFLNFWKTSQFFWSNVRYIFHLILFFFQIFSFILHQMALFTLQIAPGDREIQTINSGEKRCRPKLIFFFFSFHLTFSFLLYATCLEAGGRSFSFRQALGWDGWCNNIVFLRRGTWNFCGFKSLPENFSYRCFHRLLGECLLNYAGTLILCCLRCFLLEYKP